MTERLLLLLLLIFAGGVIAGGTLTYLGVRLGATLQWRFEGREGPLFEKTGGELPEAENTQ